MTIGILLSLTVACNKEHDTLVQPVATPGLLSAIAPEYNRGNPDTKDVLAVLQFLDTASQGNRAKLFTELFLPDKMNSQKNLNTNAKASAAADDYTAGDLANSLQPLANPNFDPDAYLITSQGGMTANLTVLYNWTVLSSAIGIFRVQSTEHLEVAGPSSDGTNSYVITQMNHQGSNLVGVAPGISWTEAGNNVYHAQFTGYSNVQGTVNALGIHYFRSSTRYFNIQAVMASDGVRAN